MHFVRIFVFAVSGWQLLLPPVMALDRPPSMFVCTDYHCDRSVEVTMEEHHWRKIVGMFKARTHPALERALIARAIALFERYVGDLAGTSGDRARNSSGIGLRGQLDCISESINTTSYLYALDSAGILDWHTVRDRARRASWLVNIHWTAVIQDHSTTREYAVDSWFLENGRAPYVQVLDDWYAKAPLPYNPDAE